jgi:hypothetical protein
MKVARMMRSVLVVTGILGFTVFAHADTEAPLVQIVNPQDGDYVWDYFGQTHMRLVTIDYQASDDVLLSGVEFYIDGSLYESYSFDCGVEKKGAFFWRTGEYQGFQYGRS